MSNTLYTAKEYVKFSANEFINMMVTALVASFIITFNDWGDTTFDVRAGVQSWAFVFLAFIVLLIITVWICKIVAIRYGYIITYRAHYFGLLVGLYITVLSKGYLPIFLPGGFSAIQPERMRLGKFHGFYRGWELGLIAATFPLVMLAFTLLFNPLYLASGAKIYTHLLVGVCLFAIYACIPVPFIEKGSSGRVFDIFKYFNGCSFGLEAYLASDVWYAVLCVTVLLFSGVTLLLTMLGVSVGIVIYIISLPIAALCVLIYKQFLRA